MSMPTTPMFLDEDVEALSIDTTRHSRAERAQSIHEDEDKATVELASIMTTASNPVSPGPSSPPLEHQVRMQDFVPPTRPSSTPFPQPEFRSDIRCHHSCPAGVILMDLDGPEDRDMGSSFPLFAPQRTASINLNDLPAEIHECILDHLFGFRVSTTSKSSITRWGTALRHSRRKELSELALVSGVWRALIQERLYRHIKLKASIDSLSEAFAYFAEHTHLRSYIKHLEIWFPVFQPKYGPLAIGTATNLPTVTADGLTNASYILPIDNCSLEEVFHFIAETLPEVQVLTLEGGERKKAPKVKHWIRETENARTMPKIHSVRTLICKGQWNLIRGEDDFEAIEAALPGLREWHALYSKPKSKSYLTMGRILTRPMNFSSFNLCLEGDYRREMNFPPFYLKVSNQMHFCLPLATVASSHSLEHFSYTGRVCKAFFWELGSQQKDWRSPRLKSIDLTVKNCCRHVLNWNESGSGITNMNFIKAFEGLVLAGIRSLETLKSVEYLRIRYVDLDSPVPPLNPYFVLHNGVCTGVWSDIIVSEMLRVRPDARFEELSESFGEIGYNKDGRMTISPEFPKSRAMSLKLANYAMLSGGISIT